LIDKLKNIIIEKSFNFDQWTNSFDKFINNCPRDSTIKLYNYKNAPDYCIWEINEESILTISYRYVHCLCDNGDMHCLQEYHPDKIKGISNFQKLDQLEELPKFVKHTTIEINQEMFLYTHFQSPSDLGYPPPYMLFNIMLHSSNVVEDFKEYIITIIDSYYKLMQQCKFKNLPQYKPNNVLVSHFIDTNFYFKDTVFFQVDESLTYDDIAHFWKSSIDGFKRAEGIIDTYRSRADSNKEVERLLFDAIEHLGNYGRDKCLSLKNV